MLIVWMTDTIHLPTDLKHYQAIAKTNTVFVSMINDAFVLSGLKELTMRQELKQLRSKSLFKLRGLPTICSLCQTVKSDGRPLYSLQASSSQMLCKLVSKLSLDWDTTF